MEPKNPKTYLWQTLCDLAEKPGAGIDEMRKMLKIGRGSVQRIKEGETSIGVDILVKIAERFNLEVWQLLVPGIKPGPPPMLAGDSGAAVFSPEVLTKLQEESEEMRFRVENAVRSQLGMDPKKRAGPDQQSLAA